MAKQEASWQTLDVDTLTPAQRKAYDEYRALRRKAAEARDAFESTMQGPVPEGQRMIFGYNFGKLSVAIVDDDRKPGKPKAQAKSLADFLAEQLASGRRA